MLELESTLDKLDNELREVSFNLEQLKKTYMELTELKMVLRRAQIMLEEVPFSPLIWSISMTSLMFRILCFLV